VEKRKHPVCIIVACVADVSKQGRGRQGEGESSPIYACNTGSYLLRPQYFAVINRFESCDPAKTVLSQLQAVRLGYATEIIDRGDLVESHIDNQKSVIKVFEETNNNFAPRVNSNGVLFANLSCVYQVRTNDINKEQLNSL